MTISKALLFTIFFFAVFKTVRSQKNETDYVKIYYGSRQGLSHNYVKKVLSDHQNMKWIATENGVTKYDGYEFDYIQPTKKYPELKNENIETLFLDSDNNLWIGNRIGGISVLDIERNTIKSYNHLIDPDNKRDHSIHSIVQDDDKNIWIGTRNNGVFVIHPDSNKLLHHFNTTCLVYSIIKDSYGNMWFNNYNILTRYTPHTKKISEFSFDSEITDLIEDTSRNKIWIATAGNVSTNIYSFNHSNQQINSLKTGVATSFARYLAIDQEGKLWIGTWSNGLYVSDPNIKNFTKLNLQPAEARKNNINYTTVLDIHIDKNNIIWLSMTHGGGVIQMIPRKGFKNAYTDIKNNIILKDCNIQSIYKDSEKLWIGTLENGVFAGDNFSTLKNIEPKDHKRTIYAYKNKLFVGFEEGFIVYDAKSQKEIFRYPAIERVNSFLVDKKNRLWIGTQHDGIAMVALKDIEHSDKYTYFHDGGSGNFKLNNTDRITEIKSDQNDNIWVGTYNGLHLFDEKSQSFLHHTTLMSKKLPSSIINSIHFNNNTMWIGTANGLAKLEFVKDTLILKKTYTKEDGLNNNFISAITNDNTGNLWLSTTTEIVRFEVEKDIFINYGEADGVQTSSFNPRAVFNDYGDQIYFGGIDNITYFDPEKITDTKIKPDIIVSKLSINNQVITAGDTINKRIIIDRSIGYIDEIILTHKEKSIALNFGLNDYSGKLNVNYKYKLEGFLDEWVDLKNKNQISLTGLPSGRYVLHITGSRDNRIWSVPRILTIRIKPSPWLSIWAYLVYIAIIAGMLWLFFSTRAKQTKLKNILEIARIDKEKEIELTEAKLNFFTNISHEFRTPLTLIISPLTEILENKDLNALLAEKLSIIQKNANRLLDLVTQLLDFRKADHNLFALSVETDDFVSFSHEVFLYFKELADSRNIQYTFQSACDTIVFPFDKNNMEIVLSNLLFNAFKNTQAGDSILLRLEIKENNCVITVKDSGRGIEKENLDKIFDRFYQIKTSESARMMGSGIGLAFSKTIIELHQGTIVVTSVLNESTEFTITMTLHPVYADKRDNANNFTIAQKGVYELYETSENNEKKISNDNTRSLILVIDDNKDIRKYLHDLLSDTYTIEEAQNGAVGYKKATDYLPDLIICDVMMPEKDGLSVCRDLKKQITTSHIPIILLTARTAAVFEIEGLKTGADDYITKPFNPAIVKTKVATLLDNRKKLKAYLQNKVRFEPGEGKILQHDVEEEFILKAIQLVEDNLQNNEFGIQVMVDKLHMSQSSLYRKIKSLTGLSLTAFIRSIRIKNAARIILNSEAKLSHVAYEVGFNDYTHFKKSFKEHFNCLPSEYRTQKKKK